MGYLRLANGFPITGNKAVISLWFKIQQQDILDAAAQRTADVAAAEAISLQFPPYPRLSGIIPLFTFGPIFNGYYVNQDAGSFDGGQSYQEIHYSFPSGNIIFQATRHWPITIWEQVSVRYQNPSLIGVLCNDNGDGTFSTSLIVRVQMNDYGSGSGVALISTPTSNDKIAATGNGAPLTTAWNSIVNGCITDWYGGVDWVNQNTFTDMTSMSVRALGPEYFETTSNITDSGIDVTGGTWHHLLVSFDFSRASSGTGTAQFDTYADCVAGPPGTGQAVSVDVISPGYTISNPCKLWIALDDVNIAGDALNRQFVFLGGPNVPSGGIFDKNSIITNNVFQAAVAINGGFYERFFEFSGCTHVITWDTPPIPQWSYAPSPIPSAGYDFGIPATPQFVDRIRDIDMAELQIFTGVILDTGVEKNRRAFIDAKGKPVNPVEPDPTATPGPGQKQADSPPVALLGKKQAVLLHGTKNWIAGKNTGTLGVDPNGHTISSGQFKPFGTIKKYTPDPALGK